MLVDLHNHTISSHDGFTSESEIINACITRGISAIAITEHDKVCGLRSKNFENNNIELIKGCEFTTDAGAHIIGLFVSEVLPFGSSRDKIVNHIKAQGGLVVMPHPWKKSSGYMSVHKEDSLIYDFDFIEALNGGWSSKSYLSQIASLSEKYELIMISSSDSHRGCQVGLCATEINIEKPINIGEIKNVLKSLKQHDIKLYFDKKMLDSKGRKVKKFQLSQLYQLLLPMVPRRVKRLIKILYYKFSNDACANAPDFQSLKWNKD